MIKNFSEFNKKDSINREYKSMERDLIARKLKRIEAHSTEPLYFDEIKDYILYEIEEGKKHVLSVGKKELTTNGSNAEYFHIEYQSPQVGVFKIYEPRKDEEIGYFELNGKVGETELDDVVSFYHRLKSKIK